MILLLLLLWLIDKICRRCLRGLWPNIGLRVGPGARGGCGGVNAFMRLSHRMRGMVGRRGVRPDGGDRTAARSAGRVAAHAAHRGEVGPHRGAADGQATAGTRGRGVGRVGVGNGGRLEGGRVGDGIRVGVGHYGLRSLGKIVGGLSGKDNRPVGSVGSEGCVVVARRASWADALRTARSSAFFWGRTRGYVAVGLRLLGDGYAAVGLKLLEDGEAESVLGRAFVDQGWCFRFAQEDGRMSCRHCRLGGRMCICICICICVDGRAYYKCKISRNVYASVYMCGLCICLYG